MLFNSTKFLIFFPAVCVAYYIIPHKVRYLFLLAASYFFYMCWNPKYALLMLTSTIITYLSGLLIDSVGKKDSYTEKKKKDLKKVFVALSFISNLLILFFFKYYDLLSDTLSRIGSAIGIVINVPEFDIILPVGISFYTFQALSYTLDVYRKEIYAEKNFFKYALFVSFFPQLVAGPIERSKNLLIQINQRKRFNFDEARIGFALMVFGFFQKLVLADRISVVVDAVYNNYTDCTGFQLLIATILFAFQIYCDFGSYSNIAIGAAKIMGFKLMDNFNTPYFSRSVSEFWRRWHISLSTWFRDYLYIPLGGSKKGKVRKYINIMIVFITSGLWHGANWHFCLWGGLNGLFQVIGDILKPIRQKIKSFLHIDDKVMSHKILQGLITFALIDFAWIFFRASFRQGLAIVQRILGFSGQRWFTYGNNLAMMQIDSRDLNVLIVAFAVLLIVSVFRIKNIRMSEWLIKQGTWLRWIILLALIFGTLIFGIYGAQFDASQFIYFQF